MNTSTSKHVATSKTNVLGLGVVALAAFNIYQGYSAGGVAGIGEADVALLISGCGVIYNRIMDRHGRKLHFFKAKINTL